MAQNLLKLSPIQFELQLYKFKDKGLMSLFYDIVKFKNTDLFNKLNPEYPDHMKKIDDIERKQTMIESELMRRGYLKMYDMQEREDYLKMQRKIFFKKRIF